MTTSTQTYRLGDGLEVPRVGFGTYPMRGEEAVRAVMSAIEVGYRLIDSAVNYENEREVGEAVRRSGVDRSEILVTTKVPGRFHAHDLAVRCVEESLERMGLEQLDLVLIHWPNPSQGRYVEAFQALVDCRERGLVRSVGVSNYTERHLTEVIEGTGVTPSVNQIELHPSFPQERMREVHQRLGIRTEAWSPLGRMRGDAQAAEPVAAAARAHDVTPAQVILRWHLALGTLPLPKSADPGRQHANLDLDGFELTADEVAAITALGEPDGRLFGGDPDTHEEM